MRARFAELGADVQPVSPAELRALLDDESKRFGAVVRAQKITPE